LLIPGKVQVPAAKRLPPCQHAIVAIVMPRFARYRQMIKKQLIVLRVLRIRLQQKQMRGYFTVLVVVRIQARERNAQYFRSA